MKFIFILITIFAFSIASNTDRVHVRSHGDANLRKEQTFEAVVGVNLAPKGRLRVRSRTPKEAAETLEAAEIAGNKAKELLKKAAGLKTGRQRYSDLESLETSLIPVSSLL